MLRLACCFPSLEFIPLKKSFCSKFLELFQERAKFDMCAQYTILNKKCVPAPLPTSNTSMGPTTLTTAPPQFLDLFFFSFCQSQHPRCSLKYGHGRRFTQSFLRYIFLPSRLNLILMKFLRSSHFFSLYLIILLNCTLLKCKLLKSMLREVILGCH